MLSSAWSKRMAAKRPRPWLDGFESHCPHLRIEYKGRQWLEEMDIDAIHRPAPCSLVLVDELAHTNAPW